MTGDKVTMTRRKLLAAGVTGVGIAALAGCASSEEQSANATAAINAVNEQPPTPPAQPPDNPYWRYVLASLDYQNRQAQAQSRGIAALIENAGIATSNGDDGGG